MLHFGISDAGLQQVDKPHQVAVYVSQRVFDGIAHAGLGRQVHYAVGLMLCHATTETGAIGKVEQLERKVRLATEQRQTPLLQTDVIVRIQIVNAVDLAAFAKKAVRQVKTYEASGSGN